MELTAGFRDTQGQVFLQEPALETEKQGAHRGDSPACWVQITSAGGPQGRESPLWGVIQECFLKGRFEPSSKHEQGLCW